MFLRMLDEYGSWFCPLHFTAAAGWLVGCIRVLMPHIMAVDDAHVFPGFLTPVLTQLFFPKPLTTLLTCFVEVRGENTQKFASTGDRTINRS